MRVLVLLSTYNGEDYIHQQIESIISQTEVDNHILIRDDGSTDSTLNILKNFEMKYKNVKVIKGSNIGIKKSFLELVYLSEDNYDYYAFSDQDDIWMKNKLSTAVAVLQREKNNIPLIYGSSVFLLQNGKIKGRQFVNRSLDFGNFLIKNYYPGCTMVFNSVMRKLVNIVDYNILSPSPLHDHWMNLICTSCGGKIILDLEPHIYYRLHANNVVGNRSLFQKIKNNSLVLPSDHIRVKICRELNKYYQKFLCYEAKELSKYILSYQDSLRNRLKLAFNREIKPINLIEKIVIFFTIILGKL